MIRKRVGTNGNGTKEKRQDRFQAPRQMLLILRKELLQRARSHALAHSLNDDPGDEGDEARIQEDMELNASLGMICASELREIDAALRRLEDDRYGICEGCSEEIPIDRLKLMPATLLCVDCRSAEEKEQRKIAGHGSAGSMSSSSKPVAPSPMLDDDDGD